MKRILLFSLLVIFALIALNFAELITSDLQVVDTGGTTVSSNSYSDSLFPSPSCSEAQNSEFFISLRQSNWLYMAAVALLVGFGIVSFTFFISKMFSQAPLEAWARNEFYQVVATVLIVFLLLVLSNIEFRVLEAFGYAPKLYADNPSISNGITYLRHAWLFSADTLANAYAAHTGAHIGFAALNRIKDKSLGDTGIVFSGEWTGRKLGTQIRNIFGIILTPLGLAIGGATAQIWFMCIMDILAFNLMLPIGILLRVTPFTRGLGSALIAIAIGFYLVYPLTLLFNEKTVEYYHGNDPNWWSLGVPGAGTVVAFASAAGYFMSTVLDAFGVILNVAGYGSAALTFSAGGTFLSIISAAGGLYGVFATFSTDFIPNATFSGLILGIFLPFLDIVITFTFVRELSKILGTDINLNSLLRIL